MIEKKYFVIGLILIGYVNLIVGWVSSKFLSMNFLFPHAVAETIPNRKM